MLVSSLDERKDWRAALREWLDAPGGSGASLPLDVRAYLMSRAPVALAMGDFYRRLVADLTYAYPEAQIEATLKEC